MMMMMSINSICTIKDQSTYQDTRFIFTRRRISLSPSLSLLMHAFFRSQSFSCSVVTHSQRHLHTQTNIYIHTQKERDIYKNTCHAYIYTPLCSRIHPLALGHTHAHMNDLFTLTFTLARTAYAVFLSLALPFSLFLFQ